MFARKPALLRYYRLSVLVGLLASVSAAAGLIAALLLMLGVVEGWTVAHELLAGAPDERPWQALLQDLGRAPGFLWGWRWVFLALSTVGPALGLIDAFAQRLDRPWRDQVTLLALLWLAGSAVITYQYTHRDLAIRAWADQADRIQLLQEQLIPDMALIFLGIGLSLLIAFAVWAYWSWWYTRWWIWLRQDRHAVTQPGTASTHRSFLPVVLFALVVITLIPAEAIHVYQQARSTAQGGDLWVVPTSAQATVPMMFTRPERQLRVIGGAGDGVVALRLSRSRDGAPVGDPVEIALAKTSASSHTAAISVDKSPAGDYILTAQLLSGNGGKLSYALVQPSLNWLPLIALLIGISGGTWLALAALIGCEFLARWVWT